jgi:hypothetical protein
MPVSSLPRKSNKQVENDRSRKSNKEIEINQTDVIHTFALRSRILLCGLRQTNAIANGGVLFTNWTRTNLKQKNEICFSKLPLGTVLDKLKE